MDYLSYKTFVWPQNPHTYEEKTSREPQYEVLDGVAYFEGMGELKRTITGRGTFSGPNAYTEFKKLQKLFEDKTAGNLGLQAPGPGNPGRDFSGGILVWL